jgi:hypothetical protein
MLYRKLRYTIVMSELMRYGNVEAVLVSSMNTMRGSNKTVRNPGGGSQHYCLNL